MTDMEADPAPAVPELTPEQKAAAALATALADIKSAVGLVERGVSSLESRFVTRALRSTASIRPRLTAELLSKAVAANLAQDHPTREILLSCLESASAALLCAARPRSLLTSGAFVCMQISGKMDVDAEPAPDASAAGQSIPAKSSVPESGFFLGLLIIVFLHDQKQYLGATALATSLVESIQALNRRTLDPIAGRIYFYYVRFYELADQVSDIRPQLLAAYRSAVLRHDDEIQATLLNALLRHYLQLNLIDQADRLVSKATFPETVGNNQAARYTYYLGRIRAIQLDYSASHRHLLQATRKAPQTNATAGFLQTATKLAVIVQLLMGEIPERALFLEPKLRTALVPYLHITQAVRVGDLAKFQETLAAYADTFRADKNLTLILRLRHNVIKAGVRRISLAYSRISLRDICLKLQLDSEEDAEYIVAKAIRDGVIDATIDHEKGFMKSNENPDIYSTTEPQSAFHQRISFCLGLHNESVKALRFPKSDANKDIATANQLLAEERKLAQDIIQAELDSEDEDTGDN